jgi:hypothetical protein
MDSPYSQTTGQSLLIKHSREGEIAEGEARRVYRETAEALQVFMATVERLTGGPADVKGLDTRRHPDLPV